MTLPKIRYKDVPENPELPPDMNYVYFENGEKFPLQIKKTNYSPVNAWWFSECSFLAYCHLEQGGKVHQGFAKALDSVWENPTGVKIFLDQLIEENPKRFLWFTGHSLGGALAGLAFTKHDSSFGLYTFGAPRFGDQELIALSAAKTSWRIVNHDDPVPLVPPDLPKIDFNFSHLGTLVYISEEGHIVMDKEEPDFAGQRKIMGKTILKQINRTFSTLNKMRRRKNHTGFWSKMSIFKRYVGRSVTEWKHYFVGLNKLVRIETLRIICPFTIAAIYGMS